MSIIRIIIFSMSVSCLLSTLQYRAQPTIHVWTTEPSTPETKARIKEICTELNQLIPKYTRKRGIFALGLVTGCMCGSTALYMTLNNIFYQMVLKNPCWSHRYRTSDIQLYAALSCIICKSTAITLMLLPDVDKQLFSLLHELRTLDPLKFHEYLFILEITERTFWDTYNKLHKK